MTRGREHVTVDPWVDSMLCSMTSNSNRWRSPFIHAQVKVEREPLAGRSVGTSGGATYSCAQENRFLSLFIGVFFNFKILMFRCSAYRFEGRGEVRLFLIHACAGGWVYSRAQSPLGTHSVSEGNGRRPVVYE